jgi:AsmA protein
MMLAVDTFSPRDLLLGLKKTLPFEPSDDSVLKKAAMQMNIEGTPENLSLSKGRFLIDETTVTFSAQAKDLAKPDLKLSATLDKLDLDRYLPPPPKDKTSQEKTTPPPKNAPIDYSPLRKLVLDARIKAGELKIKNSRMQNIEIKMSARNGIFHLDPFGVDLYQGKLAAKGKLDVRSNKPETELNLEIGGVQAGPLVTDFMKKDIIRGALNAVLELKFTGDQLDSIRKTLGGRGQLKFNDGAVVGLDLADMVRNVQTAFGLAEKPDEKPRTDFSEMVIALAINQGQAKIDGSKLNSPLLRLLADGSADLVRETLDLRITPKFVATLVGQGDDRQRSGVMVPVLVKGKLTDPKFEPDLKSLLSQPLPGKEKISQEIEQSKEKMSQDMEKTKEKVTQDLEKKAQELLKGLPFGPQK